jgi:type IV pilus assembly protein PilY1
MNTDLFRKEGVALSTVVMISLLISIATAQIQITPYCCAPPFVTEVVVPNIMLSLDNSGSMYDRAYAPLTTTMSDTTSYYGYFKPESSYVWSSNRFVSSPTGPYPGNILNWACMSRADVAKKVLTGGKANVLGSVARLVSEGRASWTKTYQRDALNYNTISVSHAGNDATVITITSTGANPPISATANNLAVEVDIPEPEYRGVLDQIGDKDGDRHWDEDAPLFGLWHYNFDRGGYIRDYIGDPDIIDMRNHINDMKCENWTPLAENYFEILHFFSQADAYYDNGNYSENPGALHDPYYDKNLRDMVPCRKSFVIMITDGESTMDQEIPNSDPSMPDCINLQNYWDGINPLLPSNGTDYLDDVCLYGHVNDMRPDVGSGWGNRELDDDQSVECFVIYAFGTIGSGLLMDAAKCGGFDDKNGDNLPGPDSAEYDKDGNGIPDNYYQAASGAEIEQAILSILVDIQAKISSGSGVSMLSVGTKAGGSTVQGQFYPRKIFNTGEVLDWIGTCQSLWLDPFGNLREDNQHDAILDLQNDYVVTMEWSGSNVMVTRFSDIFGNGDSLVQVDYVPIEDLVPIWDAGNWLWRNHNPPTNREIWTSINGVKTDFNLANSGQLRPRLGIGLSQATADTIIQYVRGLDFSNANKRMRTAGGMVWKLGDIINSGATLISQPIERYDFIYGDMSYARYYDHYRNRRQVVYVGANDGMIHAFNAGIALRSPDNALRPIELDPAGFDLGEELWAHAPYNLLAHLKWLMDPEYCHVYYVDLKPYITDVRIFPDDPVHIDGWGTLLVGGMRLGGTAIPNDLETCRSAYFAIDITDPLNPQPLWEFTDPALQYTVCYSTVVKVRDSWFLVFGSGPITCGGDCAQNGRIFVLDLTTGTLLRTFILPDAQSFIADIFACDWGIDYTVDRIYFGECHYVGAPVKGWQGKIYRIQTHDEIDPNLWTMDMVMDMKQPVTAEGSVATDEYNNLWVYFGAGRLYSDIDESNPTRHLYLGFRDDTTHSTDYTQLYNVTNINVDTNGLVQPGDLPFDSLISMVDQRLGWYRQFNQNGERNLTSSLVLGGAVLFTTFVPSADICSYGGFGNLYALFYRTGTAYTKAFLGDTLGNNRIMLSLGSGYPSEPSLYVSADQTKVFIQVGGGIVSPETGIPGLPRAGVILWKGR